MKVIIHRGGSQVGGCITEIATATTRVFVDMGSNLPGEGAQLSAEEEKEFVAGLFAQDRRKHEAVFFTHAHGDHTGMMPWVPDGVDLFMSDGTQDILHMKAELLAKRDAIIREVTGVPTEDEERNLLMMQNRSHIWTNNITFGNIRVTPFQVSHSVYDASMLLIEADGKRILHTGDYRGHGFLSGSLMPTLERIGQVDVLITEGTMLGSADDCPTEEEISRQMAEAMAHYKNVFVLASSTDIERLAGIAAAANEARRPLRYYGGMFRETLDYFRTRINKQPSLAPLRKFWHRYHSYLKSSKRRNALPKGNGFVMVFGASSGARLKPLLEELDPAQTLLIYSAWDGYYKQPEQVAINPAYKQARELFANVVDIHTSGHADASTIARVITTVAPREAVIAIHKRAGTSLTSLALPESLQARIVPDRSQPSFITVKDAD